MRPPDTPSASPANVPERRIPERSVRRDRPHTTRARESRPVNRTPTTNLLEAADRDETCSSIRESQVPESSTNANHIILKVFCVVAEAVHQNGVTLHTPNRMLDKDTDLTSGCIGSLVLLASLGRWILVTLARFLVRYCKLLPTVIRLHTQRASIDAHMQIGTPVPSGREFLLQPA